MSGGYYNYTYIGFQEFSRSVNDDLQGKKDRPREADPRLLPAMNALVNDCAAIAELARALEWYMSGDTGEESVAQAFETYRVTRGEL